MLYFCSVADIQGVMAVAPRYVDQVDDMRKAVTDDMNTYMRRILDYEASKVEIFDTWDVEAYGSCKIWLEKRKIDVGSVVVNYDPSREWSAENVIPSDDVVINHAAGSVTIYGLRRRALRALRIQYSGGFNSKVGSGNVVTDVIDGPDSLYNAALSECSYRLDKILNLNVGRAEDNEKSQRIVQRKFIGNMLFDNASACMPYRKPLG